jgi:hypothetical protein
MKSIFDKLFKENREKKSLSRTWVWRVEHKWQEVGPYNFKEENQKHYDLSQKISFMHNSNIDDIEYPNWEIEQIQRQILERAGILSYEIMCAANRDYKSGFDTLNKLYLWFDGLLSDLNKCDFVIRKYTVPEDDVIRGLSGRQLVFNTKRASVINEMEISLKYKEEITGQAGEKILPF